MPCRHFDSHNHRFRNIDPGRERICQQCIFFRKHQGRDEVSQLAESFLNTVWSIRLYRKLLKESELKYRSLFKSAPNTIIVVDAETKTILDANPWSEDLYHFPPEKLL